VQWVREDSGLGFKKSTEGQESRRKGGAAEGGKRNHCSGGERRGWMRRGNKRRVKKRREKGKGVRVKPNYNG